MKKSELKSIIKECIREELNEAKWKPDASDKRATDRDIKALKSKGVSDLDSALRYVMQTGLGDYDPSDDEDGYDQAEEWAEKYLKANGFK